jgi:hypothetical protein
MPNPIIKNSIVVPQFENLKKIERGSNGFDELERISLSALIRNIR